MDPRYSCDTDVDFFIVLYVYCRLFRLDMELDRMRKAKKKGEMMNEVFQRTCKF